MIDGANDAPAQAMTKLLGELESGYNHSSAEFQALKPYRRQAVWFRLP